MKFGKKLLEQVQLAPAGWAPHYIPYKDLKKILQGIESGESSTIFRAEGDFLSAILQAIEGANSFYGGQEAAYGARLEALAKTLEKPTEWIISSPDLEGEASGTEPDFPRVVDALEAGVHVPQDQRAALDAFLELCAEIDQLRKFSVLTSLAVTKISKKHDKHSALKLSPSILAYATSQSFYTSRVLAKTFTHAQCIVSEILTALTQATPLTEDYT